MRNQSMIQRTTCAAFVLLVAAACASGADEAKRYPGEDAPSDIRIVKEGEPGPPLLVEGTVYAPDGETPAPGVVVYAYQTGLDGIYQASGERVPRIRGYVKTDAKGRFSFRTIRPGSYPNSSIPAHIHFQLWGGGYEPQWNEDVNFADDPFISESQRRESKASGRFAWVCEPKKDADGLLRCTHDMKLKPHGDRFEGNIRHGLDNPNG